MTANPRFPPLDLGIRFNDDGSGFPAFERAADSVFAHVEGRARRFSSEMESVQRVVADALSMPRNAGGSLDLNIPGLQAAAAAAEARAVAAREMAVATRLAAEAEQDYSVKARLAIGAAEAVANEHEQAAAAARSYATAQEQVQNQLNRTASATQAVVQTLGRGTTAFGAVTNSVRASRFATLQAGQQFQDFFIQIQGGQNPLTAFSQQASQLAFVMSGAGGATGKFAAFMTGGWGTAIFAGVSVLSILIATMGSAEKASKSLGDGIDFQRKNIYDLISAIDELEQAQSKQIRTSYEAEKAALADANAALVAAKAKREFAIAALQAFDAERQRQFSGDIGATGAKGGLAVASSIVAGQIAALEKSQEKSSRLVRETQIPIAQRQAEAIADPRKGVNLRYDEQLSSEKKKFQDGKVSLDAYRDSITRIEKARESDLEALKKHSNTADRAANAAARLAERGEDAAKKISNITDRFSDIPPQQQAVNRAMRELDDLADDFAKKKPPNYAEIVELLKEAGATIQGSLNKPLEDALETQQRQYEIGQLILGGRQFEADVLRELLALQDAMGPLTRQQVEDYLDGAAALHDQTREHEKQQRVLQNNLRLIDDQRAAVKDLVSDLLSGRGINSIGSFIKNIFQSYTDALAEEITQSLVGDFFDKQSDKLKGETKLSDAGGRMATATDNMSDALKRLTKATNSAADAIAKVNGTKLDPANDNPITVTANQKVEKTLKSELKVVGKKIFGEEGAAKFGKVAGAAMQGAAVGTMTSGVLKSLGVKQSKLGAQIGGAIGSAVAGPLGALAGSLIGGTLGGLLKKSKYGTAVIGATSAGTLGITGTRGNSSSRIAASEKSANALLGSLDSIAEQFGASIDASKGKVSIGQYKNKGWRVSTTGYSGKLGGKNWEAKGIVEFGDDAAAAAEFAMLDLVKDGVLVGLRKGTQQLLTNAKELQDGLAKALKFENVFRDLKRAKDPVGAAVDDLNREFQSLINIFKQAGASAEEMAQLEELYGIKRKDSVKQAFESVSSALKSLLNDINIGDSGYSLRTRLGNAQAAFNPLAARVQAGDTTAYDAFAEASRQLMEISREYYGSGSEYFQLLDQIKSISQGQVDYQQRLYDAANGSGQLSFNVQPIVSATETQTDILSTIMKQQLAVAMAGQDNGKAILAAMQQLAATQGRAALFPGRWNF